MHCIDPFSFQGKLIYSDNEEMSHKSEVQTFNFWQQYMCRHIYYIFALLMSYHLLAKMFYSLFQKHYCCFTLE